MHVSGRPARTGIAVFASTASRRDGNRFGIDADLCEPRDTQLNHWHAESVCCVVSALWLSAGAGAATQVSHVRMYPRLCVTMCKWWHVMNRSHSLTGSFYPCWEMFSLRRATLMDVVSARRGDVCCSSRPTRRKEAVAEQRLVPRTGFSVFRILTLWCPVLQVWSLCSLTPTSFFGSLRCGARFCRTGLLLVCSGRSPNGPQRTFSRLAPRGWRNLIREKLAAGSIRKTLFRFGIRNTSDVSLRSLAVGPLARA